ncbi:MAG TPA: O-antigen translocase [Terracidiphilus sp.]|nr:O-antigen translocase [Terracidiphilus sp.]
MAQTPDTEPVTDAGSGTYGEIVRSSALIGGSSALNMGLSLIRTKVFALILGPTGFGLFGIYRSIASLAECLASLGINTSGVRQIAHAAGSDDSEQVGRTATVMRATSIVLGIVGTALLVLFSRPVSRITFGDNAHAGAISLLSIAVFYELVAYGYGALIQGKRHVADLARVAVWGALLGTALAIPFVYFLGEKGIVPSIVSVSATSLAVSWWYGRRVKIEKPSMTLVQIQHEASELLNLGIVFMATYLITAGVAYAVRIFLLRENGLAAAGFYQSAWTLGGFYVGFILDAMGADFYPRLTGHCDDHATFNRMVNEQTQVGLLLAGPGVLATLSIAPLVIELLYSSKFGASVGVLRWILLGTMLQVVNWPMGYMIIAKGRQALYFATEFAYGLAYLGLAWICVRAYGLNGAGIAFFGGNLVHGLILYPVVHRLSGFGWSTASVRRIALFFTLVAMGFSSFYLLPAAWAYAVGTVAALFTAWYSIRELMALVSWSGLPRPVRKILGALLRRRQDQTDTA